MIGVVPGMYGYNTPEEMYHDWSCARFLFMFFQTTLN